MASTPDDPAFLDYEPLGDWYDEEYADEIDLEQPIGVGHWVHTPYDDIHNERN
ncbi:hypothetical protein [Mycolicibacterium mucogenicum]|uniref:hypothetical protein n=1 Tax=Mycolicibacterium mucogenicum TaxID=56689 RepID=UPI000AA67366|nr:hypothetical protein [Mycolicibacterium mucogenicum]